MDPESLQTFFANAFAVQESGLDSRSLAALIDIQQFIGSDELQLNRAMQTIVDRALTVANASGVAIGMLKPEGLVYLAGSGSAAKDVGRRVAAVFSSSSQQETRPEILRVENAGSDPRIEAEICRQFGASSLLMLPIYKKSTLAGVLQVLFDAPHSFAEREVRVYRLMVGALEEVMFRAERPEPVLAPHPVELIPINHGDSAGYIQSVVSSAQPLARPGSVVERDFPRHAASFSDPVATRSDNVHAHYLTRAIREGGQFWNALAHEIRRRTSRLKGLNPWNAGAAIGATLALSLSILMFHRNHSSGASVDVSLPTAQHEQQPAAADPLSITDVRSAGDPMKEVIVPKGVFRRVRVGPNEVDYISDDVTIRRFQTISPETRYRSGMREVDFGDDVTVRYFGKPALASPSTEVLEAIPATDNSYQVR